MAEALFDAAYADDLETFKSLLASSGLGADCRHNDKSLLEYVSYEIGEPVKFVGALYNNKKGFNVKDLSYALFYNAYHTDAEKVLGMLVGEITANFTSPKDYSDPFFLHVAKSMTKADGAKVLRKLKTLPGYDAAKTIPFAFDAAYNLDDEVFEVLVENGVGCAASNEGKTVPLLFSVMESEHWATYLNVLVKKDPKFDVNVVDKEAGSSILHALAWSYEDDTARWSAILALKPNLSYVNPKSNQDAYDYLKWRNAESPCVPLLEKARDAGGPQFASENEKLIHLLSGNNKDVEVKLLELDKKELQQLFPDILIKGILPVIKEGFPRMNFTTVPELFKGLHNAVPPRILSKHIDAILEVSQAMFKCDCSKTPGYGPKGVDPELPVYVSLTAFMPTLSALMKSEPSIVPKLGPMIADLIMRDRKKTKGKALNYTSGGTYLITQFFSFGSMLNEYLAKINETLMDIVCNDPTYGSMLTSTLAETFVSNPGPILDSIEDLGDVLEKDISKVSSHAALLKAIAESKEHCKALKPIMKPIILAVSTPYGGSVISQVLVPMVRNAEMRPELASVFDMICQRTHEFSPIGLLFGAVSFVQEYCHRQDAATATRGLTALVDLAKTQSDPNYLAMVVVAARNIYLQPGMDLAVLDPFLDTVKAWQAGGGTAGEQAKQMLLYREGKDLESIVGKLDAKVDDLNTTVVAQGQEIKRVDEVAKGAAATAIEAKEISTRADAKADLAVAQSSKAEEVAQKANETAHAVAADLGAVKADVAGTKQAVAETNARVDAVSDTANAAREEAAKALAVAEQAKADMAAVQSMVDAKLADMKEFVATVAKKLPQPCMYGVENKALGMAKKIVLHFECGDKSASCLYPGKAPAKSFTTSSTEASKWLKLAVSTVKVGLAVMQSDPFGGIASVKDAYDALMTDENRNFKAFVSEPFLTSSEQDNLINQLREANFFENFAYNAQTAAWRCTHCQRVHEKSKEASAAATSVVSSSSASAPSEPGSAGTGGSGSEARVSKGTSRRKSGRKEEAPLGRTGWLEKRGQLLKRWNRKYWQLSEQHVVVCDDEKGKEYKKFSPGLLRAVASVHDAKYEKSHCFTLTTVDGVKVLSAPSAAERDAWVAMFQKIIDKVNGF